MFKEFFWTLAPWIFNRANSFVLKAQRIYQVIYNECKSEKELVFLKGFGYPIHTKSFGSIDQDTIQWKCSLNPPLFFNPISTSLAEKHISYLGFTIRVLGKEIELTDWVNDVKYVGDREPTLQEIFFLWSYSSGESYFHCLNQIQIEYIDTNGDIVLKGLMDTL
jgi:hypothetical protein